MIDVQVRSSPPDAPAGAGRRAGLGTVPPPGEAAAAAGARAQALWRRQVRHDIRHELGTIIMLASAVAVSADVGPASRERIEALLGETRWLDHLIRQLDDDDAAPAGPERVRVDELVGAVVAGLRLSSPLRIGYTGRSAWAHADPLALWRAVRNVLDNACRVAAGRVDVRVHAAGGRTVVRVDDDGPGFGAGSGGLASLGLGIVHDVVSEYGGHVAIGGCDLGGARVDLTLPAADHP